MFQDFLTGLNDFMYTYILIFLLVGCGLYYSIRTRFVQVRGMKDVLSILKEKSTSEEGDAKQVSSFQALMISTASRVGTGNIAGIATALAAGGPGAVFWMWLMAIVGGSSAFAESTLAQIYKVKDGGPSYYIERALHSRKLGVLFSVALIACFSYGFNGLQSYNISSALPYYIDNYNETIWPAIIGLILAVLTGLVIFGGVHRIGTITSVIVPIMAIGYILLGLYMTVTNITLVPSVLALVFKEALNPQAIAGGFAGSAVVIGIKRGLFSNEAGMGSAPNAAASAEVSHPAKQGLVQTLSVFIDTLIICSTTAMMLLVSQIPGESGVLDGIPYVQAAVKTSIGELGIHFITLAIFFFAFSSLVGNYYYAESNIRFIKDNKTVLNVFRCTCLVAIFLGAQADFSTVWNLADILMGFMAIINIFAILALSNIVIRTLKNYEKQRKEGKDPVFKASDVGLDNTDCWK